MCSVIFIRDTVFIFLKSFGMKQSFLRLNYYPSVTIGKDTEWFLSYVFVMAVLTDKVLRDCS